MKAAALGPAHPVATVEASVCDGLGPVAETPVWSLSTSDSVGVLAEVARLVAQVARPRLRLLGRAERVRVGSEVGATSARAARRDGHHPVIGTGWSTQVSTSDLSRLVSVAQNTSPAGSRRTCQPRPGAT